MVRQSKLRERYYFTCTCCYCSNPKVEAELFAIKCGDRACPESIPVDERAFLPCPRCGFVGDAVSRRKVLERAAEINEDHLLEHEEFQIMCGTASDDDNVILKRCLEMLNIEQNLLHPKNMIVGLTTETIGRILLDREDKAAALVHIKESLLSLRNYYSNMDIILGMNLLVIGELELKRFKYADAEQSLQEAERILRVSDSENGPLHNIAKMLLSDCKTVSK